MARLFNGTNQVISLGSFTIVTPFSLSIWHKWQRSGTQSSMALFGTAPINGVEFRIATNATNTDAGYLQLLKQNVALIGTSAIFQINNQWHHAGVAYDGTTGAFYMDGLFAGPITTAAVLSAIGVVLGENAGNATDWFNGSLQDAAAWNAILTASEFKQLASGVSPLGIRRGSLTGYWPLNGTSPESDLSGAGNNGTVTGATFTADRPIFIDKFQSQYNIKTIALMKPSGVTPPTTTMFVFDQMGAHYANRIIPMGY